MGQLPWVCRLASHHVRPMGVRRTRRRVNGIELTAARSWLNLCCYLATLAGLFTQRNKVFMKVTNTGNDDMVLTVPFCAYHSSCVYTRHRRYGRIHRPGPKWGLHPFPKRFLSFELN